MFHGFYNLDNPALYLILKIQSVFFLLCTNIPLEEIISNAATNPTLGTIYIL